MIKLDNVAKGAENIADSVDRQIGVTALNNQAHTPTAQSRGLTWDYVCELERQRDALLKALREIVHTPDGHLKTKNEMFRVANATIKLAEGK